MISSKTLPREIIVEPTYTNLNSILADIQADFQVSVDNIENAYNIDKADEKALLTLIESFSLLPIYNALPSYYHGSGTNSAGDTYLGDITPDNKVVFMRKFIRTMLRLRKKLGIPELFDGIMGLLGIPNEKFVLLQDFIFYASSTEQTYISERVIFSKSTTIIGQDPPTHEKLFKYANGDQYHPTQTITVDVIDPLSDALGSDFILAIKVLLGFLKPPHIIIKDVIPALYLRTDNFFNINLTPRGRYTVPNDFRAEILSIALVATVTGNKLVGTDLIATGILPGMLITSTEFTLNTITDIRVVTISDTEIELNSDDITLVAETKTGSITYDYDHSFMDGYDELTPENSTPFDIELNTIVPTIYQAGVPIPTLSTDGSYQATSPNERTDYLDTIHNNDLTARIGGSIEIIVSPSPDEFQDTYDSGIESQDTYDSGDEQQDVYI